MAMQDDIITPRKTRSRTSHAGFSRAEARGPVIDQEGREIPQGNPHSQFQGFQFELGGSSFAPLTREQRIERPEGVAKPLDRAFVCAGPNSRYGSHWLNGPM